ncbi:MAG TPA: hypothetical protein ENN84_08820, partial [Candidatus Marinimicrobia bacterium]|nr:hypothetical protein [Candidatus Neomarinimicrobiota bacterium]
MKSAAKEKIFKKLRRSFTSDAEFRITSLMRKIPDADLVPRFIEAAEKLNAFIYNCQLTELPDILKDYGSADSHLLAPDISTNFEQIKGVAFTEKMTIKEIAEFSCGITAPRYGLAQTGTLAELHLLSGERLISLIPETHIAVLPVSALVTDHHQVFQQIPPHINLTLISGPSRTADIEKRIVIGAHGPKKLVILLVNNK